MCGLHIILMTPDSYKSSTPKVSSLPYLKSLIKRGPDSLSLGLNLEHENCLLENLSTYPVLTIVPPVLTRS